MGPIPAARLVSPRRDLRATAEDVEDLLEPVQEFVQFDECMFTVGARNRSGYRFRTRAGRKTHRSALSFDLSGRRLPAFDVRTPEGRTPTSEPGVHLS